MKSHIFILFIKIFMNMMPSPIQIKYPKIHFLFKTKNQAPVTFYQYLKGTVFLLFICLDPKCLVLETSGPDLSFSSTFFIPSCLIGIGSTPDQSQLIHSESAYCRDADPSVTTDGQLSPAVHFLLSPNPTPLSSCMITLITKYFTLVSRLSKELHR